MRLPLLLPDQLSAEQIALYKDMKSGIASEFNPSFRSFTKDGALLGPWSVWIHDPIIGGITWELVKAMSAPGALSEPVRQTAILVVGGHFNAAYELYAHMAMEHSRGVSDSKLTTIATGSRPGDMNEEEGCAYDVAHALVRGGILPEPCYAKAIKLFGQQGTSELVYLVSLYALVSITLNGFNVAVPVASES
jgi:hypothetical protein